MEEIRGNHPTRDGVAASSSIHVHARSAAAAALVQPPPSYRCRAPETGNATTTPCATLRLRPTGQGLIHQRARTHAGDPKPRVRQSVKGWKGTLHEPQAATTARHMS